MLEAAVTLDTKEPFGIQNNEVVRVPNIANILNVKSDVDTDGFMNGVTNHCNPRNFITITPFLVMIAVDMIASSRGDA